MEMKNKEANGCNAIRHDGRVCCVCLCSYVHACIEEMPASLLLYNTLYARPVSVSIREKGEGRKSTNRLRVE